MPYEVSLFRICSEYVQNTCTVLDACNITCLSIHLFALNATSFLGFFHCRMTWRFTIASDPSVDRFVLLYICMLHCHVHGETWLSVAVAHC